MMSSINQESSNFEETKAEAESEPENEREKYAPAFVPKPRKGNKVLVTGMGMVTPLGASVDQSWHNLLKGESGVKSLKKCKNFEGLRCQVGALIHDDYKKIEEDYAPVHHYQSSEKVMTLANCIVSQAVKDSPTLRKAMRSGKNAKRIGVLIANHHGIHEKEDRLEEMSMLIPKYIAFKYNLKGLVRAPPTAEGEDMNAMQQAYWLIQNGGLDAAIVGGLDYNVNRAVMERMEASAQLCLDDGLMQDPEACSRPFDKKRSGIVMADGGSALVLMSEKFWLQNNSGNENEVYCEIGGLGQTVNIDFEMFRDEEVRGIQTAMLQALTQANIELDKDDRIDLINCEGQSSQNGDRFEIDAIHDTLRISKAPLYPFITATKGNTGHLGAGACTTDSIFAIKSMQTGQIPAIKNLHQSEGRLNYAKKSTKSSEPINVVMKNGQTITGSNYSVLFRRYVKPAEPKKTKLKAML